MNLSQIQPYLLYEFKSESELAESIKLISHNFNFEREKIGDYTKQERLVAAYACFYGLTNLPKLKAVLEKTDLDLSQDEVVDIGCGPGTFSLAALNINPTQKLLLIEKSDLMRKQAARLLEGIFPHADYQICESTKQVSKKSMRRTGLFGHSANEMNADLVLQLVKDLELDRVLFIEPGTKDFFKQMLTIRERLLAQNFKILYPCPLPLSCPLENDWCHQYINIRHDPELERLCQLVKKDRRFMPLTIHYYTKELSHQAPQVRIIRMLKPLKYAQPLQVCVRNEIKTLEVLYRGLTKAQQKSLQKLTAGDIIEYEIIKELEQERLKVKWILTESKS